MDQSTSREEIENKIKNIENEIAELRQANDGIVDFVKIGQLEDEIEILEHALEEIVVETAQNSGIDFDQAKQNEEMGKEEQEEREAQQKEDEMNKEMEAQDEKSKDFEENDWEEEIDENTEKTKPFSYWEYQSGVVIIPYDGSRSALSGKEMTREEFVKQLSESVTIIRSPGMAEAFFQNRPDDWGKLRNSKEEFQKTMIKYKNDLPVDLDTKQAYVLYQTDEDTVHEVESETKKDSIEEYDNATEETPEVRRSIEILKKHISSTSQKTAGTVLMASEALKQAEKGTLKEEELDSVTETIEKKEEVMQEERQEEPEVQEEDTLGETLVKTMLVDSIDNAEMVDDTMKKSALASVSLQMKDAIENGIENEEMEREEEEELLPGMNPKI